ncbi:hypothetical protein L227DRAFT_630625 [Lentinus tigrinus ALCF2SS1-6]|uniref:F-box domain-containing protein n=2 Tax=Lentinus tigrinus TaxID=5365 RepID=A0A5C2SNI2_9APHY|nr:hypothetical protein L227DRAFT_630625 [Lentinus tigrinus ALCF2SS1-6]
MATREYPTPIHVTFRSTAATEIRGTAQDLTAKLPAELMLEIFLILKAADGSHRFGFTAEWVRVTWVCSRWRAIALSYSHIWSSVSMVKKVVDTRDALEEQLLRSRNTGLDLRIEITSQRQWNDKLKLVGNRRRNTKITMLDVTYTAANSEYLKKRIACFRDSLRSLKLCRTRTRSNNEPSRLWVFDPHDLPHLQSLSVTYILPRATSPWKSITRLEIVDLFSTNHLLPFLHCFPSLEELLLMTSRTMRSSYDPDALSSMPFIPKLRLVQLNAIDMEISWSLTPSMRIPELRILSFGAQVRSPVVASSERVFRGLFSQKLKHVFPLGPRPHSALGAEAPGVDISMFGITIGTQLDGDPDVGEYQQWSVVLPRPSGDRALSSLAEYCPLIQRMPSRVNSAIILRLDIHVGHSVSVEQEWTLWLKPLSQVHSLVLGCGALVREVLPHLRNDLRILPALKNLKLCLCKLDDGSTTVFSQPDFCQWLRHRKALQLPLENLTIREPADRPQIPDDTYIVRFSELIAGQVRDCDTGIERAWPIKEACMVCDSGN